MSTAVREKARYVYSVFNKLCNDFQSVSYGMVTELSMVL